jgi:hypothetical protein
MFRGPSWIQRAGVALLLLASLGAGSLARPHADDADIACTPILVAHDESAHHMRADPTTASAESEHCFLCHSLRSHYPAFDKFEYHHSGPRAERLHITPIDRARFASWALVPGRAPPV